MDWAECTISVVQIDRFDERYSNKSLCRSDNAVLHQDTDLRAFLKHQRIKPACKS